MVETVETASPTYGDAHQTATPLSPARSALAQHLAAVAASGESVAVLQGPRDRLAGATAIEAEATAELDEIARQESQAMSNWASRIDGGPMPEPHTAARKRAGEKLAKGRALAAAAKIGMTDLEDKIATAAAHHRALAEATPHLVNEVLLEIASIERMKLEVVLDLAAVSMLRIAALSEYAGRRHTSLRTGTQRLFPPTDLVQGLLSKLPSRATESVIADWNDLSKRLAADATASL
jgi:hypothetical protein